MTQTLRFEGVSLPVSDVARSVAFYRDMVGFVQRQLELPLGEVYVFALPQ